MSYPILILKKGREQAIQRRHPWIFSGAFAKRDRNIKNGQIVWVGTQNGDIIATGHYSDASIMVRVLDFKKTTIDLSFFSKQIEKARNIRSTVLGLPNKKTNAYRLIAGEGDNLSGLIVDMYDKHAIIQCHTIGMYEAREQICEALQNVFEEQLETVFLKSIHIKDSSYESSFLYGNTESTTIQEHGVSFKVNWKEGQKTGFFLDQRDNRKLLQDYSQGRKVLNTFCYTGGFSAYALEGGAEEVVSVDISETAMNMTDINVGLTGKAHLHSGITDNVLDYLKKTEDNYFDIIVLDPPAFAKNRKKTHNAVQAYKRINRIAMRKIKSNGLIFTFSCSQVIHKELFDNTVRSAAMEAERKVKILKHLNQSPDHVIDAFHQEGHYLKGLIIHVSD